LCLISRAPTRPYARLIRYEYYDYPSDFVFQFQRGVQATTTDAVLQAAQTNLDPEQLVILVVGNTADIQPPLTTLPAADEITAIDVTIPEPEA
jgi:zinc protease